jgi:hypothetical protein
MSYTRLIPSSTSKERDRLTVEIRNSCARTRTFSIRRETEVSGEVACLECGFESRSKDLQSCVPFGMSPDWERIVLDISAAERVLALWKERVLWVYKREGSHRVGNVEGRIDKQTSLDFKACWAPHLKLWITGLSRYFMLTSLLLFQRYCL